MVANLLDDTDAHVVGRQLIGREAVGAGQRLREAAALAFNLGDDDPRDPPVVVAAGCCGGGTRFERRFRFGEVGLPSASLPWSSVSHAALSSS